jgi:hypothetical protein
MKSIAQSKADGPNPANEPSIPGPENIEPPRPTEPPPERKSGSPEATKAPGPRLVQLEFPLFPNAGPAGNPS